MSMTHVTLLAIAPLILSLLVFGAGILWLGNAVGIARGDVRVRPRRVLAVIGVCSVIAGLLALAGALLLVGAIPLLVVSSVILLVAVIWFRQAEADALVWSLGQAMRHRIGLDEVARAFAVERSDRVGRRSELLAQQLAAGVPAARALRSVVSSTDLDTRLLLDLSDRIGTLPAGVLNEGEQIDDSQSDAVKQTLLKLYESAFYLMAVLGTQYTVVLFFLRYVLPTLRSMMQEFALPMPTALQLLSDLSPSTPQAVLLAMLLGLGLWGGLLLAALGFSQMTLTFLDLPLLSRLGRPLDRARILRALSLGVAQRVPMNQLCHHLAEIYPKGFLRRYLRRAAARMDQGEDAWQALWREGLLRRSDVGALSAAQRVGNLPWMMDQLAATIRRRYAHRLHRSLQIVTPIAILTVAAVVLLFAVGLLGALASLTRGLA